MFAQIVSGIFLIAVAAVDAPPRYDVAAYCRKIGNVAGGSAAIERGCLDNEQQAYDLLKSNWSRYPARAQTYCDRIGRVAGGSYSIMKGCMDNETNAAANPPAFRY